jgi:hypothetical protein
MIKKVFNINNVETITDIKNKKEEVSYEENVTG